MEHTRVREVVRSFHRGARREYREKIGFYHRGHEGARRFEAVWAAVWLPGENSLNRHGGGDILGTLRSSLARARDFACGLRRPQDGSTSTPPRVARRSLGVAQGDKIRGVSLRGPKGPLFHQMSAPKSSSESLAFSS